MVLLRGGGGGSRLAGAMCHTTSKAQCVLLTCRLTCRLPIDQIFKITIFLFLNFRWKHFVILFPCCFDRELREQDGILLKSRTAAHRKAIILKQKISVVEKFAVNLKLGNWILRMFCFLVLAGNHSWSSNTFLLFPRLCVTQGAAQSWCVFFHIFFAISWCTKGLALFPKHQRSEATSDSCKMIVNESILSQRKKRDTKYCQFHSNSSN